MRAFLLGMLLICSQTGSTAYAVYSCSAVLGPEFNQDQAARFKRNILGASRDLKRKLKNIDPRTSHLDLLVPFISGYLLEVKNQLSTKENEPLYSSRSADVLDVLSEAEQRIQNRQLTYQYIVGLPFRLGVLLNMRLEIRDSSSRGENEIPMSKDSSTFTSHERFMKLLELTHADYVSKYSEADGYDFSSRSYFSEWVHLHYAMEHLKEVPLLPAFGELDFETLNIMSAVGVWPIGSIMHPYSVDGQPYQENTFPIHDLLHALLYFVFPQAHMARTEFVLSVEKLKIIQNRIFNQFMSSKRSEKFMQIMHFIHHIYFHEISRSYFSIPGREKNAPLSQKNEAEYPGNIRGVFERVRLIMYAGPRVLVGSQRVRFAHLFDELEKIFPDRAERESIMRQGFEIYFGYLDQALSE